MHRNLSHGHGVYSRSVSILNCHFHTTPIVSLNRSARLIASLRKLELTSCRIFFELNECFQDENSTIHVKLEDADPRLKHISNVWSVELVIIFDSNLSKGFET
jgi:hypothetical protein